MAGDDNEAGGIDNFLEGRGVDPSLCCRQARREFFFFPMKGSPRGRDRAVEREIAADRLIGVFATDMTWHLDDVDSVHDERIERNGEQLLKNGRFILRFF